MSIILCWFTVKKFAQCSRQSLDVTHSAFVFETPDCIETLRQETCHST